MSVGPHEVDVPITDLDARDDNFRESEDGWPSLDEINDPLDISEEDLPHRFDQGVKGLVQSVWSKFSPANTTNKYQNISSASSDPQFFSDDEDSDLTPNVQLREYTIRRLNQRLYTTVIILVCTFSAVILLLFIPRSARDNGDDSGYTSLVSKRILSNSTHNFHPTTIIVSLDGFHPHYINSSNCPSMHEMLSDGFAAPYMTPLFPSSTFPNHWTLVTGLYPSEHGIVGNTFYDPKLKSRFINVDPKLGLNPKFWEGGEPIWLTAAKQGVNSAVHMWPGSEVPLATEHKPLFVDKFNKSEVLSNKVDRTMQWLDVEDISERPELILTYVPTVDTFGHKFGISGEELTEAIRNVDDFVALMRQRLTERNLDDIVNLVIVSDHGMAPTSKDRLMFIDDLIDLDKIAPLDGWPLMGIRPREGYSDDEIFEEIQHNLLKQPENMRDSFKLYRVGDLPKEWHFGGDKDEFRFNYRLAPLWIIPDVGYLMTTREIFKNNNEQVKPAGVHGYDNTHVLMRAIFLGQGPYFKEKLGQSKKVLPFTNLNVYNIICDGLDLQPSPNNGSSVSSSEFPLSSENLLPTTWGDSTLYPNLPFEVEHVVANATYDNLWRQHDIGASSDATQEVGAAGSESAENFSTMELSDYSSLTLISLYLPAQSDPATSTVISSSTSAPGLFGEIGELLGEGIDFVDDGLEIIGSEIESGLDYVNGVVGDWLGNSGSESS